MDTHIVAVGLNDEEGVLGRLGEVEAADEQRQHVDRIRIGLIPEGPGAVAVVVATHEHSDGTVFVESQFAVGVRAPVEAGVGGLQRRQIGLGGVDDVVALVLIRSALELVEERIFERRH